MHAYIQTSGSSKMLLVTAYGGMPQVDGRYFVDSQCKENHFLYHVCFTWTYSSQPPLLHPAPPRSYFDHAKDCLHLRDEDKLKIRLIALQFPPPPPRTLELHTIVRENKLQIVTF